MQNIALQITLNGVPQAVSSIKELETAIKQAKVSLDNTTAPGTEEFKKFNSEIEIAERKLQGLKKASDADTGKFLGNLGKLGSAIAGSFAAATAAVSLFGGETEDVTAAAAQAQNALTVALGAASAAEGLLTIKKIAGTIATEAQTLATVAANTTTKAFYTTLAANPYGAILAVIGLVVAAVISLTGATEDADEAEKKYQATLEKTKREREFQLQLLQTQGASEIELSERRRSTALQDLREARTRLEVLKRDGASQKQINEELNIILENKKIVLLENARIEKITSEERSKNDKELADDLKKNSEERLRLLLEELELQGELRQIELERTTKGVDIELSEFDSNLEKRNEVLKSLKKNQSDYNNVFEEYRDIIKETSPEQFLIDFQFFGEGLEEQSNAIFLNQELIRNSLELAGQQADIQEENLINLLTTQSEFLTGQKGNTQEYIQNQKDLIEFEQDFVKSFVDTNIKGFKGSTEELATQRKILSDQAQIVFENLIENGKRIVEVNQYYKEAAERTAELRKENEGLAKSTEVLNGFLEKNGELISKSIDLPIQFANAQADALILEEEIATRRFDQAKIFATDIEQLEFTLLQNGIDIRNASYEEKLKLLLKYLKLEITATEDAEAKKKAAFDKTIKLIQDNIAQLQAALGAIAQTTTDLFDFQLSQLEKRFQRTQANIVGDTDEINAKRLEAEKIYNAERERLEKQAAKTQLRISLAQSIANTAQAITAALATGPVIGQILAGITAAASAVQVGIITAQLNAIDTYKKGGKLRPYATGGLVKGPAHEYGGVKYQGGGIELEGNESIINRVSTVRYQDLLNQINLNGGGAPIINNFDDSRIVEAIATQRREPIRAYVVESDITSKQNIQRRLELLSQI
jgi:hypothetical protein